MQYWAMKATIRTFQSGCGDCIFLILEDAMSGESFHIMIDCGLFTPEIKTFVVQKLELRIDLLIVTHYDDDHIAGIIKMLLELEKLKIGKILFNCFQDYDENAIVEIPSEDKDLLDKYVTNIHLSPNPNNNKISASQAALLSLLLKSNDKWFKAWNREILIEGDAINVGNDTKWGRFLVLSPSSEAWDNLKDYFVKEYVKCVHSRPPQGAFENQDAYWEMLLRIAASKPQIKKMIPISSSMISKSFLQKKAAANPNEVSITSPNKASLALVWECNGKRILLGGDAIASQLYEAIKKHYDGNHILFEAIKIPHHGSKNNMSNELSLLVDTEHYFLTGGKKDEGPNYEALAKIILHPIEDGIQSHTVHYNRILNLTELQCLIKDEYKELLESCKAKLTNENEYTFEY